MLIKLFKKWFKTKPNQPERKPLATITLKLEGQLVFCDVTWDTKATDVDLLNICRFLYIATNSAFHNTIVQGIHRNTFRTGDKMVGDSVITHIQKEQQNSNTGNGNGPYVPPTKVFDIGE